VRASVAPGTFAPVGSVMVPLNPPVTIVCAGNTKGKQSIVKQQTRATINKFFLINSPFSFPTQLNASPSLLLRTHHHRTHRHSLSISKQKRLGFASAPTSQHGSLSHGARHPSTSSKSRPTRQLRRVGVVPESFLPVVEGLSIWMDPGYLPWPGRSSNQRNRQMG
jgi:hypothetical protein